MSSKHHKHSAAAPAGDRTPTTSTTKPTFARNMLYAVIGAAVTALGFGIYSSQTGSMQSGEAQAATTSERTGAGQLASMARAYNFGDVSMAAGNVRHLYTVSNTGTGPVTITKMFTSCMCTTATLVTSSGRRGPFGMPGHAPIPSIRERLAPGELAQIEVVFDPAAHGPAGVGRIDRSITLENDAGQPFELAFTAMVRP